MVVTRLVRGVRNPQKIAIYIDSKYTFSVLENILSNENIYVGRELDKTDLDRISSISQRQEVKSKVLNLIGRRPRSEWEVSNYLKNRITTEEAQELITELKESDYINDTNFATWWIDQRRTFTNKSVNAIRQELMKKGIDRETIDTAFSEIDTGTGLEADLEAARALLHKKTNLLAHKNLETKELNQKLITYLQNRGFSWETIKQVINQPDKN